MNPLYILLVAVISDLLDYFTVLALLPVVGDALDLLATIILYRYIGVYAFVGSLELIPAIDLLPAHTAGALVWWVREKNLGY